MKKGQDVPGNAVASAQAYQRTMVLAAEQIMRFGLIQSRLEEDNLWLMGMSIRTPAATGSEFLVIMRAQRGDDHYVCFASSDTLLDSVRRMCAMLENNTAKWKEDKYAAG